MKSMRFNGFRFKREYLSQGYTLAEFTRKIGESVPTASKQLVCNWANGHLPSGRYLMLICQVLRKQPEFFFSE